MYRTYTPMTESCMCWGFSHGDGWFDIIWQLSLAIEDELNYSWYQKRWFVLYDRLSLRWNRLIYKLSPVRKRHHKMEGKGTREDPIRRVETGIDPPPLDEKIVQYLFGEKTKIGRFEVDRTCLKKLALTRASYGFSVVQVKEKFGTLRFYANASNERISRLITLAERLTDTTCEDCGEAGKERPGGWIRTLCDDCYAKRSLSSTV